MAEASGVAQSFSALNYSGALFNKGNTRTPLLSAISGRRRYTDAVEFVVGQQYTTEGGTQPAISETASLTAPSPGFITRSQMTNVTQIFQESFGVSYAKQSNMGTLSGVNVAGQQPNPISEVDFQASAKLIKIAQDMEYTALNGTYQKASNDTTANKTRGVMTAITTNTKAMANAPLTIWDVALMMQTMAGNGAPIDDLTLWCDATTLLQLNADAAANGLTVIPASREINGIAVDTVITPLGVVNIRLGAYVPAGTAGLLNLNAISPVEMLVPGKGNFFLELLAKQGAGDTYQIFGQFGIDHGPEWFHGKFTGISTTFEKPSMIQSVTVQSSEESPIYTQAVTGG